jgi:electron transport complex protein RnfD
VKSNNYDSLLRPYWYSAPSLRVMLTGTLLALAPLVIMLFVTKSYRALAVAASAVSASLLAEVLNKWLRNSRGFQWMLAGLQGLITGLFFPEGYPLISVFSITLFTLLMAKYAFGGIASSWINQTALTIALAYMTGPQWFPGFLVAKSQLGLVNPVALLFSGKPVPPLDAGITDFLNSTVAGAAGSYIPPGLLSFFWDSGAAVPVFRFNALILAASMALILFDIIHWVVPACYLGVYLLLVWLFAPLAGGGGFAQGDVLLASLTGGVLFTAFFMLGAFGTVPWSLKGKILYGVSAGCFAFVFSGGGTAPAGAVFTVLAANLASLFIQFYEQRARRRNFREKLLPLITEFWRLFHD